MVLVLWLKGIKQRHKLLGPSEKHVLWVLNEMLLMYTARNSFKETQENHCDLKKNKNSKTCVKQPLKTRQNKDLNDKW